MTRESILIVEDDKHISRLVAYNLEKAGYDCAAVNNGGKALDILAKKRPDMVILDIMLPDMDGFEVCRVIKQDAGLKNIPVIILTAKGEEVDRIVGLELGADDYVVKPFSPRELILRIKAVLKRGRIAESKKEIIKLMDLAVDLPRHKVTVNNREITLTPIEFRLLVTLIERQGRVQSRDTLLSDVWGIESDIYTRTVDTHVKRLREKLGRTGRFIETVRGLGYKFKEENDEE